jgi:hypothetical protein
VLVFLSGFNLFIGKQNSTLVVSGRDLCVVR